MTAPSQLPPGEGPSPAENRPAGQFSLLIVDDEPLLLSSMRRIFHEAPYEIFCAGNGQDALKILEKARIDAALIDLRMPGLSGMDLLRQIRARYPKIMSMMITGHGGVPEAVEALKLGALDFLEKPFSLEGLQNRVAEMHRMWLEDRKKQADEKDDFSCILERRLIGKSVPMQRLKDMILRVAPGCDNILIYGETGTGKELVARAIHQLSPRRDQPFIPVDCASLSQTVMESELFGHTRGAFTGAHSAAQGLIRASDKGTLFLDEVGELSLGMQAKFLRTIQEKEVRPVGSTRSFPVDLRLVAATNRVLSQEVAQGRFREDLLYRLDVITLQVPPLRERGEDISLLADYFLTRFRQGRTPAPRLTDRAREALEQYYWPGNVRELENIIRRMVALGTGQTLDLEDLPEYLKEIKDIGPVPLPPAGGRAGGTLAAQEKTAIENALRRTEGNRRKSAEILGISEATLYRKIRLYGLHRPEGER
jgi:DNA-binding NtrC family response regulator